MNETSRDQKLESILHAYMQAADVGQEIDREELLRQHPELAAELREFFTDQEKMDRFAKSIHKAQIGEATIGADGSSDAENSLPRIRYFGDYELIEEIARGGMGVVYKARQVSLNRVVALKMILAGELASSADVLRFNTEAEAAASLDHPHIVPIYEVGQHEGQHFFSMKLIEGGSLSGKVANGAWDGKSKEGQRRGAVLVATVARAVHHAHQRGILHRDLKPGNILLDQQGQPHVTDFGLARRVEGDSGLTQSGAIVGTPSYMAPEQARAQKQLTTAIDTYSLGAILYDLLTGRPPFRTETPLQTLLQVVEQDPAPLRSIQPKTARDLETICLKCLAKDPAKRYESAAALADDLDRWLRDEPITARRASSVERLFKWARRRPAAAALIGVSVLALATLLVGGVYFNLRLQEQVHTAWANQYVAYMSRAEFDWENSDIDRVIDTLDTYRPSSWKESTDHKDVRGWEWYFQDRLCHQDLRTLKGHNDVVYAVAFSPDGSQIASASRDGTLKLWDTATGKQLRTLEEMKDPKRQQIFAVMSVAFSPDGKHMATGHEFGDVRLWDTAEGSELRTIKTGGTNVRFVAFSPDGRQAAAQVTYDVQIFDTSDGRHLRTLRPRTNLLPYSVAFSPDGRFLVTAGGHFESQVQVDGAVPPDPMHKGCEGVVQLWDLSGNPKEARELRSFEGHSNTVMSAAFSPDGTRLATASWDGSLKIWDVADGKELHTFTGHVKPVTSVAFSPDGTRLASASADRTVRLWDAVSGQELQIYHGHLNNPFPGFHDELVGGPQGFQGSFQNAVYSVAFSPDGTRLASAGVDRTIKVWNAGVSQQPRIIKDDLALRFNPQAPNPLARAISPDARLVALASREGTVKLCDASTGQQLRELKGLEKNEKFNGAPSVAFSPDSARVAATSGDGTVKIWDANSGQETRSFKAHTAGSVAVAFSPDGGRLATAGLGENPDAAWLFREVRLWDSASGQELRTILSVKSQGGIEFLAFSPDWKRLALTDQQGGLLYLWDAATGQKPGEFRKPPSEFSGSNFTCMAFSPDGIHVAVGFFDGKVDLWDANTGRVINTLQGHAGIVDAVAFSPDGMRVVAGHRDGTVKLWDLATAQEVRTLKGHTRSVKSLAFSKNGTKVMSAAWDGTVRIWDARPLTSDITTELEAVGLLDSLFARPLPKGEVLEVIRNRLNLSDDVRRLALELAKIYREETDAEKYYTAAWPLIRHPYANVFMVQTALAQMKAAVEKHDPRDVRFHHGLLDPEWSVLDRYRSGVAVAHYRLGKFQKEHYPQALAVLAKCNQDQPTTLSFLAMTQHQLGQKAEGKATLARLRRIMQTPDRAKDHESQAFLAEAEALMLPGE